MRGPSLDGAGRAKPVFFFGLAAVGGALVFAGFPGVGAWPLSFVAFIPLFAAIDGLADPCPRSVLSLSWFFGFVAVALGYFWLIDTLGRFAELHRGWSLALSILFFAYVAVEFSLFGWLWYRATRRGFNATLSAVAAFAAVELAFPNPLPFYYGASLHTVLPLIQVAELGGPLLVGSLCMGVNGALYEIFTALAHNRPVPKTAPLVISALISLACLYGVARIAQVDARIASADTRGVGLVQTNTSIVQRRENPAEDHHRHLEQSVALERKNAPDLILWPESSFTSEISADAKNLGRRVLKSKLRTPLLFGGLSRRAAEEGVEHRNTAFLLDRDGTVLGSYDKTRLLPFGETLPFQERFPSLSGFFPRGRQFTAGRRLEPLVLGDTRISVSLCYESISPSVVRRAVKYGTPHLLVNLTNDAWFGDSHEPWIHLALSKLRAVEHRRALVRATSNGVSAVIDPTGRVVARSGLFKQENLYARVPLLVSWTPFLALGHSWGWVAAGVTCWMAFVGRRGRRAVGGPLAVKTTVT